MAKKNTGKGKALLQASAKVKSYREYAASVDVHQTPTKGINSGAHGRAYEQAVKLAMGNLRFNGVSGAGRADTTKKLNGKMATFECKQGAGELAVMDKDGEIVRTCCNSDYIIYCISYNPKQSVLRQAYVMTMKDFMELVDGLGLVRNKMSSAMYKLAENERYYDRMALQTISNSPVRQGEFEEALKKSKKAVQLGYWLKREGVGA